jgi:hypothetical protein
MLNFATESDLAEHERQRLDDLAAEDAEQEAHPQFPVFDTDEERERAHYWFAVAEAEAAHTDPAVLERALGHRCRIDRWSYRDSKDRLRTRETIHHREHCTRMLGDSGDCDPTDEELARHLPWFHPDGVPLEPPATTEPVPRPEEAEPERPIDARWWLEVDRLDEMLAELRANADRLTPQPGDPGYHGDTFGGDGTLLDVVLDEANPDYCTLGPKFACLDRGKHQYRSQYARCKGGKCPSCIDYWLHNRIRRALTLLDFPDTLRITATDLKPPRSCPFWIRQHDGSYVCFWLDGDGEDVPATLALLEAFLGAARNPGRTGRRHRKLPRDPHTPTPGQRWVPLASSRRVEDVNLRVSNAIGRDIPWNDDSVRQKGLPRASFSARWRIGLDPAEEDTVDAVLDIYHGERKAELERWIADARGEYDWLKNMIRRSRLGA